MSKPPVSISDLQATELVARLKLSRTYAFELIKRQKTPSLAVALRIEREFGVPASAWLPNSDAAA
jgi:plasmid maintenance system antidote protein VapI